MAVTRLFSATRRYNAFRRKPPDEAMYLRGQGVSFADLPPKIRASYFRWKNGVDLDLKRLLLELDNFHAISGGLEMLTDTGVMRRYRKLRDAYENTLTLYEKYVVVIEDWSR